MDILFLLRIIRRKFLLLIIVPFISGVAAVFFSMNMELRYNSDSTIATSFTTGEPISFEGERFNRYDAGTQFINAIETINSPMVLDLLAYRLMISDLNTDKPFRAIQVKLKIEEKTEIANYLIDKHSRFEYLNPSLSKEKEIIELIKALGYDNSSIKEDLKVFRVNNSDYIKVFFQSENPLLSAFVVNALSEEFIRFYNEIKISNSSESVKFFASLVQEKEKQLQERINKLNDYKLANSVVDLTTESQSKISLILQYEKEKNESMEKLRNIKIELEDIDKRLLLSGKEHEGSTAIAATNKKIIEIKNKIAELRGIYIEGGSNDTALKEQIDELNGMLFVEMSTLNAYRQGTITSETREEIIRRKHELELNEKMTLQSIESIVNAINIARGSVSQFVGKEALLANLQADVNVSTQEYQMAQEKHNSAKNQAMISKSGLKQISLGQPADKPESSKRILIILMAAFASFFLCLGYVLVAEFIDTTIRIPSRLEHMTKIKNIGIINFLNTDLQNIKHLLMPSVSNSKGNLDFDTFRQLTGKIRFEIEKSKAKVILFTSTREDVGKSFLVIVLSHSLSLINKRVLIIDTNFKNNTLTKLLVESRNTGLLRQDNSIGDDENENIGKNSIISATFHKGIDIIGNSGGNYSPLEIFKGGDFNKFLSGLENQYDYIFLEGASLNRYSDSQELSTYADKIIVVFSANSEITESDKESIEMLKGLKDKIIGTVLNKVELRNLTY